MQLARVLKRLMAAKDISTRRLAGAVNVSSKTLDEWLVGRSPRDLNALKRCADYFGVTIDALLFDLSEESAAVLPIPLSRSGTHSGTYEISIRRIHHEAEVIS